MGRACNTKVEKRNACTILVGKLEGKRPLGRRRRTWADDIKMDPREVLWAGMEWIDVAQDRDKWRAFLNMIMSPRVP
jgi:hypothetical protein